jgi:hypothetical protein
VRRVAVAVLAPTLCQHAFFLGFQHRETANFFEITGGAPGRSFTPAPGREPLKARA